MLHDPWIEPLSLAATYSEVLARASRFGRGECGLWRVPAQVSGQANHAVPGRADPAAERP